MEQTSAKVILKNKLKSPKIWIFFWLTLLSYWLMFFTLFWQFLLFRSMIFVMLLFLFFHFFYLEIRKFPIKYLLYVMILATLIGSFFIWFNIWLLASLLVINMGIVYLAWILQWEWSERIHFSSQWYFNVGGYMFTVFITIAYSLFVVGYYQKFPFTCEILSERSNSVVDFFTNPFKLGIDEIKTVKDNTQGFFATKLEDIITIGQKITITTDATSPSFLEKLSIYKEQLIDQTIKDNTKVNMGICDYVLGQINEIYSVPWVKISVIALMFLLLYGFIRIEFWVMTGIGFIFFKILYRSNIYRTKKVMKEIEELE